MENYLKYALFFLTLSIILIASCSEETPIVPPETIVANAGSDQIVNVWDTVYLQGSMGKVSEDLEYIWSFVTMPQGSQTDLSDSSISSPSFVIDKIGRYVVKLVVMRGEQISKPDSVSFTAAFQESNQYFPNSVGSKWIYLVIDSIKNTLDTVSVEIIDTKILPNNFSVAVWLFSCVNNSGACFDDTLYVRTDGDTVFTFLYNWQYNRVYGKASYIFPLVVGNGWNIDYDISLVTEEDSISINAGTITEAFRVQRQRIGAPTYELFADTWFVHNIGLLKMDLIEIDTWSIRFRHEHWELIYYHLAE